MIFQYIIILSIIIIYFLILYILKEKKINKKYNLLINGPLLLVKSTGSLKIIEKIKKYTIFWSFYSNIGLILFIIGLFFMTSLLIENNYIILLSIYMKIIPKITVLNQFNNILLLPGFNDFIPLSWGFIALIVTLVIHEFSHAIISRVENIKVLSIGIILFVIPIGGFAEIDDKSLYEDKYNSNINLKKSYILKKKRLKILSSGVTGNFFVAMIFFFIFFGPVLNYSYNQISWIISDSKTFDNIDNNYFIDGTIIKSINDIQLNKSCNIEELKNNILNSNIIKINIMNSDFEEKIITINEKTIEKNRVQIISGIKIDSIDINSPIYYSNLKSGDIILEINEKKISTIQEFNETMISYKPLDTINIKYLRNDIMDNCTIKIGYKDNTKINPYIGIIYSTYSYIHLDFFNIKQSCPNSTINYLEHIQKSLFSIDNDQKIDYKSIKSNIITLISLPFIKNIQTNIFNFNIISIDPSNYYKSYFYYILSNISLWIGWMNLYVGLFNCIPAYPLDGGYFFKTIIEIILQKYNYKNYEAIANNCCILSTNIIYISFAISFLWPYISSYFLI